MIRQLLCAGLFLAFLALVVDQAAFGQAGVQDKIYIKDAKDGTVKPVMGELKETSPGLFHVISGGKAITDGKGTLELTAADIVRVVPGAELPGLQRDKLLDLDGTESGKDYAKARAGYEQLLKADLRQPTRRFVETRYNLLRARLLEEADDETRTTEAPQLATSLTAFLDAYPKGWEMWPAGRALARIHADRGKFDEAAKTWGKLAKSDGLAKDLRDDAALREIDALIRDGKPADAATRVADLAKNPPTSTGGKDRLAIYQAATKTAGGDPAAAIKEIEGIITKTRDPLARASGYAMIGELQLAAKKLREAMWAYLWVEVVFNQDRDEVLNAMSRLVTIFEALNDKERADSYKERIRKYRSEA